MRKFYFALIALACVAMFSACEKKNKQENNGGNQETTESGNISQDILVANLPQNFKATTLYTVSSAGTLTESHNIVTKFGADWVLSYNFHYDDGIGGITNESKAYYLRFKEDGTIVKQFESIDGGNTWNASTRFTNFRAFAESSSNPSRRLFDKSIKQSYGTVIEYLWHKTGEKRTVCNRMCTEYQYQNSVYLVDDATLLVFHEDFDYPDTGTTSEFAVQGWDESISSIGYNLPN